MSILGGSILLLLAWFFGGIAVAAFDDLEDRIGVCLVVVTIALLVPAIKLIAEVGL